MKTIEVASLNAARRDRMRAKLPAYGFDDLADALRCGRWHDRSPIGSVEAEAIREEMEVRAGKGPAHYRALAERAAMRGDQEQAFALLQEAWEIERHERERGR